MSVRYTWVQWNRHKKVYDLAVLVGVALFIAAYIGVSFAATPTGQSISPPILLIRATGACAIVMLHLILAIGPLARLLPNRFAPLLYNRRHFGVAMCGIALVHGVVVLLWYGGFGVVDPVTAILTANPRLDSFVGFPFEIFGALALVILFLMAATSHDFWLKNLSPRWWKTLHMGVYVAYALLVLHVALGTIQAERSIVYPVLIGGGAVALFTLHVVAGWREVRRDLMARAMPAGGLVDVASIGEIPKDRAKVVAIKTGGRCDRVAVFRHGEQGEKLSAVANVCAHQGGPLGEGKIVDGCITCPWHGYQYQPETGQSPPPYTETIPTYELRVEGERVMLNPEPNRPGTRSSPRSLEAKAMTDPTHDEPFYVGYLKMPASIKRFILPWVVGNVALAVGIAVVVAQQRRDPGDGTWDTGQVVTIEGILADDPYPLLRTDFDTYLLVEQGKVGVQDRLASEAIEPGPVLVTGFVIERDGRKVIELDGAVDEPIRRVESPRITFRVQREDLGPHTLRGEIVDPKCYLGVMQPGDGKTHKTCATLCIRGGIPPMFVVRDAQGETAAYLLTNAKGEALPESDYEYIADPVELSGRVYRENDLLLLHADLGSIRRLGPGD